MLEAADPMPSDPMPSGRWMASENPVPRHKPPTRASVLRDQSARHAHTYRALGAPGRLLAAGDTGRSESPHSIVLRVLVVVLAIDTYT